MAHKPHETPPDSSTHTPAPDATGTPSLSAERGLIRELAQALDESNLTEIEIE